MMIIHYRTLWHLCLTCIVFLLMSLAIMSYIDQCFHASLTLLTTPKNRCGGGHNLVFGKSSISDKSKWRDVESETGVSHIFNTTPHPPVIKGWKQLVHEKVEKYFGPRRDAMKMTCMKMLNEESEQGNGSKFFMQTIPEKRSKWIYYRHKNKVDIQWCPLYKSASTPWMAIFVKLAGGLTNRTETKIRKGKGTFINLARDFRLLQKTTNGGWQYKFQNVYNRYSMLVVRHPFKRILSAYRDKLERVEGREYYHKKYSNMIVQKFRKFKSHADGDQAPIRLRTAMDMRYPEGRLANDTKKASANPAWEKKMTPEEYPIPSFKEFCQYLVSMDPTTMDEHWRPQYLDCSPCHHHFDLALKVEDMESEKHFVFDILGIEFNSKEHTEIESVWKRWTNESPAYTNDTLTELKYFSQLDYKLVSKLYSVYEPDFKLFGYSVDQYFKMV